MWRKHGCTNAGILVSSGKSSSDDTISVGVASSSSEEVALGRVCAARRRGRVLVVVVVEVRPPGRQLYPPAYRSYFLTSTNGKSPSTLNAQIRVRLLGSCGGCRRAARR